MAVYKDNEFQAFITTIEHGQQSHWVDIATVLSINKNTITAWKNTPEAQEAIRKGIERALQCMEQAGARDWRMWREKLKMLGLDDNTSTTPDKHNPVHDILHLYGLLNENNKPVY